MTRKAVGNRLGIQKSADRLCFDGLHTDVCHRLVYAPPKARRRDRSFDFWIDPPEGDDHLRSSVAQPVLPRVRYGKSRNGRGKHELVPTALVPSAVRLCTARIGIRTPADAATNSNFRNFDFISPHNKGRDSLASRR